MVDVVATTFSLKSTCQTLSLNFLRDHVVISFIYITFVVYIPI